MPHRDRSMDIAESDGLPHTYHKRHEYSELDEPTELAAVYPLIKTQAFCSKLQIETPLVLKKMSMDQLHVHLLPSLNLNDHRLYNYLK